MIYASGGEIFKLDGATGAVLWGPAAGVVGGFAGTGLAVDAAGNIYHVGGDCDGGQGNQAIVKLSGATRAELWRKTMCSESYSDVAIDGAGNAIAAGEVFDAVSGEHDIAVVKYSTDGLEVWAQPKIIAGTGDSPHTETVATDGSGDVFVAGCLNGSLSGDSIVVKLSGATGAELWRQTWATLHLFVWVAADGAGDVIACCKPVTGGRGAVKYSGANGAELWSQFPPTIADSSFNDFSSATQDHQGDVLLSGRGIISKVNGADGTEAWSLTVSCDNAVAVDQVGNVVAGGGSLVCKFTTSGTAFPAPVPVLPMWGLLALVLLAIAVKAAPAWQRPSA